MTTGRQSDPGAAAGLFQDAMYASSGRAKVTGQERERLPSRSLLSHASDARATHAEADRGLARRFADRVYCGRQGHVWRPPN